MKNYYKVTVPQLEGDEHESSSFYIINEDSITASLFFMFEEDSSRSRGQAYIKASTACQVAQGGAPGVKMFKVFVWTPFVGMPEDVQTIHLQQP